MKKLLYLIILLYTACQSNQIEDNRIIVAQIDAMDYSECQLVMEVDSLGNTIDTLQLIRTKFYDAENNYAAFESRRNVNSDYKSEKTYFWKNGGDFRITYEALNYSYLTEIVRNRNKENLYLFRYDNFGRGIDSSLMEYQYEYSILGKKERIIMNMGFDSIHAFQIIEYNENEKASLETLIFDDDTIRHKQFYYLDNNLIKTNLLYQSTDTTITIKYFGQAERNDSITIYSINNEDQRLKTKFTYHYDENSEYLGYDKIDFVTNKKKRVRLQKIPCEQD